MDIGHTAYNNRFTIDAGSDGGSAVISFRFNETGTIAGPSTKNAWHHLALCGSNGIVKLYHDGTLMYTFDASQSSQIFSRFSYGRLALGDSAYSEIFFISPRVNLKTCIYSDTFTPATIAFGPGIERNNTTKSITEILNAIAAPVDKSLVVKVFGIDANGNLTVSDP
ncbi:MAG: hypothetical protein EOM41_11760, partial [Bacilli bacterium]|nr:hypothetical protein [Bacilli bacterium]